MSTHYIEEAQRLADTVMIMSHGRRSPRARRRARPEHAGREALEVYGRPARLAEVEAEAAREGSAHAAHGHERLDPRHDGDGDRLDGERRPANLEDVFVLLTGEEIG